MFLPDRGLVQYRKGNTTCLLAFMHKTLSSTYIKVLLIPKLSHREALYAHRRLQPPPCDSGAVDAVHVVLHSPKKYGLFTDSSRHD